MPFLATAISGLVTAFQASAIGAFLTTGIGRLLASVALSALQVALQPKPRVPGITTEVTQNGGTNPAAFVLGRYATAGAHICPPMTHGTVGKTPNAYLTYVIDLGDVAGQSLSRVMIDGAYVTLGITAHPDYGLPVQGRYTDFAWVKFYDGTQTLADPQLIAAYGGYPERPWTSNMVGTGMCYAIMTFRYNRNVFGGFPQCRFEMDGIRLYDPRKDTTVGGSGAQRWATPSTWAQSDNPVVMAYNIMRGITITGLGLWGGNFPAADLPLASWFSAMNECDVLESLAAGGTEPRYRAGYEVMVNAEPASVLDELFKGCAGQVAEVGGIWKVRVGGPALPVYFMTDADVVVSKNQEMDPFPPPDRRNNGIAARYPEPNAMWEAKDAPPRYNATWEAEDGNQRLLASLDLSAVPYGNQVQRIMKAYITDERRFRRHALTLPPDAAVLEPLDTLSWTSARNGYVSKVFDLSEVVDDARTLLQRCSMREVDPTDYSWTSALELPTSFPSSVVVTPAAQAVPGWAVAAFLITDGLGASRRPALRLSWTPNDLDAVTGIHYMVRVKATLASVKIGTIADVTGGEIIIADGIVRNTVYQARARLVGAGRVMSYTAWTDVTSPTSGLLNEDFETGIYSLFTAQGLYAIRDVTSLPGSGAFVGEKVFNRTDGKLYQWTGVAWTLVVAAPADASISTASFAANIRPVEILAALPATANFEGRMVFLTVDDKLYRHLGTPTGAAGFTRAVDGADLVANSVTAGVIAAGAIGTTQLAAQAIVASKVVISDFTNLYPDFDFEDPDMLGTSNGAAISFASTSNLLYGKRYANIAADAAIRRFETLWFPIEPDTEYKVSAGAFLATATAGSGTATIAIETGSVDGAGLIASLGLTTIVSRTDVTGTTPVAITLMAASNAKRARFVFTRAAGGTAIARTGAFKFQKKGSGDLFVDGTLTGAKIVAQTITGGLLATSGIITNSAQINNALINNAHITGAIQSDNYVNGVAGWQINKNGNAQFRNLIVRDSLVVGSVTDVIAVQALGEVAVPQTSVVVHATLSVGATGVNEIRKRGVAFEAKTPSGLVYEVRIDFRYLYFSVWSPWVTLNVINIQNQTYGPFGSSSNLSGIYQDVEYRVVSERGSGSTPGYIRNIYMTVVNVAR